MLDDQAEPGRVQQRGVDREGAHDERAGGPARRALGGGAGVRQQVDREAVAQPREPRVVDRIGDDDARRVEGHGPETTSTDRSIIMIHASTGPARSGHPDEWPVFEADPPPEECTAERLLALGLGDGLPVVPPTRARIERMLDGVADPTRARGAAAPARHAQPEAIAYQAVLAGCEPAWLDVVFAAVRACAEPEFNALGLLTTTGTAAWP